MAKVAAVLAVTLVALIAGVAGGLDGEVSAAVGDASSMSEASVRSLAFGLKLQPAPNAAPLGDYGDAPDGGPTSYPAGFAQMGRFPTLHASDGARTLDVGGATLGPTASLETDANDLADPDGVPNLVNADLDDGSVNIGLRLVSIPPPATATVEVHGGNGGNFFLNILIDLNMDGTWGGHAAGGEPEWVVQNHPISVGPGEVIQVAPPPFAFGNGNLVPTSAWMRVALTSEPVDGADWNGRGQFQSGEIQDHQINRADSTPPGPGARQPGEPAGPVAEYGDAPDGNATGYPAPFAQRGNFPTLAASNGALAFDVSRATLGPSASVEEDANDPADPDGAINLVNTDSDDGIVDFVMVLNSIPPPASLSVAVSGGGGGAFFLNVLIDLDMDGNWGGQAAGGEPEWVVQNFPVTVPAGQSIVVTPPAFAFANGNRLPDGAWMRMALTSERVAGPDWDGSGGFNAGEIEDHVISLPVIDGKPLPVLELACDDGGQYHFGPGVAVINFTCTVTNLSRNPGTFTWTLIGPLTGGVGVGPVAGGPIAIGPFGAVAIPPGGTFVATRGDLPSTWRIRVTAVDPPAVMTAEGVTVGFGDSELDLLFTEQAVEATPTPTPPPATPTPTRIPATPTPTVTASGVFEMFVVHGVGASDIVIQGQGFGPNQTIVVKTTGPGVLQSEISATTSASGTLDVKVPINRYGQYEVNVGGVTRSIDVR